VLADQWRMKKMKIENLEVGEVENRPPSVEQSVTAAQYALSMRQKLKEAWAYVDNGASRFNLWDSNTALIWHQVKSAVELYDGEMPFRDWLYEITAEVIALFTAEQAKVMNETYFEWTRDDDATLAKPIKHILGKCRGMGVNNDTLAEIKNHTRGLVWEWISTEDVRTAPHQRRKNGKSLTKGLSIFDVRLCACTTPECKCKCKCGKKDSTLGKRCASEQCLCPVVDGEKRHRKNGKGCVCHNSIKKWLYKLASHAAEEWKYKHEAKSNPQSLDAMAVAPVEDWNAGPRMGTSGCFIDMTEGGVDHMAADDYWEQQDAQYLEDHGELPEAPSSVVMEAEEVLENDLKPQQKYADTNSQVVGGRWATAPSLMSGKHSARFMQAHVEHPTAESKAIIEAWRPKLVHVNRKSERPVGALPCPVRYATTEEWDRWTGTQGAFTMTLAAFGKAWYGLTDDPDTLPAKPAASLRTKNTAVRWHPVYGKVYLYREVESISWVQRTAKAEIEDRFWVPTSELLTEKPEKSPVPKKKVE
jgi:hypothetical protein